MIDIQNIKKEWIDSVSSKKKADKILVEKVIRALLLLEGLSSSNLDFVFKGGTALMLLLGTTKRLSIDIDIIVPDKDADIQFFLNKFISEKGFVRWKKNERATHNGILKEHYKLYFISALNEQESYVLLDVLKEEIHYKNLVDMPIRSSFLKETGTAVTVKTPDFNNIMGDKLTAFAPTTTGIPYMKGDKEMGMEIIKQMYDIGSLFDNIDNVDIIKEVFESFAKTELKYRGNLNSVQDVLDDVFNTSLSICLRKDVSNSQFNILEKGIKQVNSYIFSENFHIDKAISYATKAAYIAILIKYPQNQIVRYATYNADMKNWEIKFPQNHPLCHLSKLNKLKKSNIEAFHYWHQIFLIISTLK